MSNTRPTKIPMKAPASEAPAASPAKISLSKPPAYTLGEKVATRLAYGTGVAKLGEGSPRVIALDAETKNSTYADKFKKAHPERFIECFIAEQNLVGAFLILPRCCTAVRFFFIRPMLFSSPTYLSST